jgi:predicted Na+-dependent transporter
MNAPYFFSLIMNLSTLVFVVTSMLVMGLSLTMSQIIAPLRNARLVILALVANFILVHFAAYLISASFPLSDGLKIGLLLVSTAAEAPFLPKLAQMAKGGLAFSVGLMVLLMVTTVLYIPLMLPLLLRGVTVNPWDISRPLILLMLLPLATALFVKAHYAQIADALAPFLAEASNLALILLVVAGMLTNLSSLLRMIDSTQPNLAKVMVLWNH